MTDRADAPTDARLVGAVAGRSERALAELYGRHGGDVWSLTLRVCRDRELAQDVVQNVFCDLWARPGRFDPARGTFRAWVLAQAHARSVDAVRAEEARRRREHRIAGWAPAPVQEPDSTVLLDAVRDSVRRALDALPATERQAIVLAYLGGTTYREAARRLAIPEGTVKYRIRTGLARLREQLEAQGVTP
jgi:RNA polymerase sigma-70 factor (ECF subfamily)